VCLTSTSPSSRQLRRGHEPLPDAPLGFTGQDPQSLANEGFDPATILPAVMVTKTGRGAELVWSRVWRRGPAGDGERGQRNGLQYDDLPGDD